MGKTKKRNKKGGGIGNSKPEKPEKPHTPLEKTRKNVNFSPTTKSPSSPKQNKTKKMFISRNKERQKAVTKYENRQEKIDLMDMALGKIPLKGGKKKKTRRRKKGGNEEDCPICLEQIQEDKKITTGCNHNFHRECFIQYCLTELSKGNFKQRDRENKVFQCPNCRGNTKAECLTDPEVRAIYEGLQPNMDYNDDNNRLEVYHIIEILENKLENTIQQSENRIISDEAQELFLEELRSDLSSNDDLSDADLGYIFEGLEQLLDTAEIEYGLDSMMVYEFTRKIQEQVEEFEEQDETEFMGGKNKSKKGGKSKRKSGTRKRGGTVKQGFGLGGIQFEKSTGHKRWEKNPETGEYEAHDQDCYGIGWFKTCKTKSDVSSKPWWSFW